MNGLIAASDHTKVRSGADKMSDQAEVVSTDMSSLKQSSRVSNSPFLMMAAASSGSSSGASTPPIAPSGLKRANTISTSSASSWKQSGNMQSVSASSVAASLVAAAESSTKQSYSLSSKSLSSIETPRLSVASNPFKMKDKQISSTIQHASSMSSSFASSSCESIHSVASIKSLQRSKSMIEKKGSSTGSAAATPIRKSADETPETTPTTSSLKAVTSVSDALEILKRQQTANSPSKQSVSEGPNVEQSPSIPVPSPPSVANKFYESSAAQNAASAAEPEETPRVVTDNSSTTKVARNFWEKKDTEPAFIKSTYMPTKKFAELKAPAISQKFVTEHVEGVETAESRVTVQHTTNNEIQTARAVTDTEPAADASEEVSLGTPEPKIDSLESDVELENTTDISQISNEVSSKAQDTTRDDNGVSETGSSSPTPSDTLFSHSSPTLSPDINTIYPPVNLDLESNWVSSILSTIETPKENSAKVPSKSPSWDSADRFDSAVVLEDEQKLEPQPTKNAVETFKTETETKAVVASNIHVANLLGEDTPAEQTQELASVLLAFWTNTDSVAGFPRPTFERSREKSWSAESYFVEMDPTSSQSRWGRKRADTPVEEYEEFETTEQMREQVREMQKTSAHAPLPPLESDNDSEIEETQQTVSSVNSSTSSSPYALRRKKPIGLPGSTPYVGPSRVQSVSASTFTNTQNHCPKENQAPQTKHLERAEELQSGGGCFGLVGGSSRRRGILKGDQGVGEKRKEGEERGARKWVRWGLARMNQLEIKKFFTPDAPIVHVPKPNHGTLLFRLDCIDQINIPGHSAVQISLVLSHGSTTSHLPTFHLPLTQLTPTHANPNPFFPISFESQFPIVPNAPFRISAHLISPIPTNGEKEGVQVPVRKPVNHAAVLGVQGLRPGNNAAVASSFNRPSAAGSLRSSTSSVVSIGGPQPGLVRSQTTLQIPKSGIVGRATIDLQETWNSPDMVGVVSETVVDVDFVGSQIRGPNMQGGSGSLRLRCLGTWVPFLKEVDESELPDSLREAESGYVIRKLYSHVWKTGYMMQKGGGLQTWERRYFMVVGNMLLGYKDSSRQTPLVTLDLSQMITISKLFPHKAPPALLKLLNRLKPTAHLSEPEEEQVLGFEVEMKDGEVLLFAGYDNESSTEPTGSRMTMPEKVPIFDEEDEDGIDMGFTNLTSLTAPERDVVEWLQCMRIAITKLGQLNLPLWTVAVENWLREKTTR
ncbi:hypothetical protein HDV05_000970 [Chytridiales sp. JEL 0842]|nr:hypothetical protein HDV05_000970 [Chytridiales sp. JEL 0842]